MAEMRELYITVLKGSIDYILEDIEEAKLFEMVSIVAKLAEQSAHTRRERKRQEEIQERHNTFVHNMGSAQQQVGMTGAQIGALPHG